MTQRPGIQPGVLTTKPNQAGNTAFVHPDLVRGTLREGVNVLRSITDPFSRALVVHFLLVDVHPFNDGNGRISRIMMTKELLAAGRSEEHTSELQSLMRISYAVFCLKKNKKRKR